MIQESLCNLNWSGIISDLIVTLFGSFLGVYFALIADKKQENKRNKELLFHFSSLIDDIVSSTKKQIENVKKLSDEIIKHPLDIHLIGLIATLDFERIKSIDSNNLYKSYSRRYKKSLDEFKKTFAYLDYLSIQVKDYISRNEKHINFIHNDQIYVRDQLELLIYKIGMYVVQLQQNDKIYKSNPDYIFLSPYMEKLSELTKNSNNSLANYEFEILTPLNNSILHDLGNIEIREELFRIIKQSKNRIDNIRYNSLEHARSLIKDLNIVDKAIAHLDSISMKIKQI